MLSINEYLVYYSCMFIGHEICCVDLKYMLGLHVMRVFETVTLKWLIKSMFHTYG